MEQIEQYLFSFFQIILIVKELYLHLVFTYYQNFHLLFQLLQ